MFYTLSSGSPCGANLHCWFNLPAHHNDDFHTRAAREDREHLLQGPGITQKHWGLSLVQDVLHLAGVKGHTKGHLQVTQTALTLTQPINWKGSLTVSDARTCNMLWIGDKWVLCVCVVNLKESEQNYSIGSPLDGVPPGPKTDRIKDNLGRYCSKTFETRNGKKGGVVGSRTWGSPSTGPLCQCSDSFKFMQHVLEVVSSLQYNNTPHSTCMHN